MKLEDYSIMPFGKYKGKTMEEVPANYLLYLKDEMETREIWGGVGKAVYNYIVENLEVLREEYEREMKKNTYNH